MALCDADDPRGGSWSSGGSIVFAPDAYSGLSQVSSAGGAPVPITTLPKEGMSHRLPQFLPDGKRLLYYSAAAAVGDKDNGIFSLDLASKKADLVVTAESGGLYAAPGHLLFVRDGNLMAQPFDAASARVSGEAVPIAEKVTFNNFRFTGAYTVAANGLLLFQTGAAIPKSQLTWFDLEGKKLSTLAEPASFPAVGRAAISPDGQRATIPVQTGEGRIDLWVYEIARGVGTRFTFGPETYLFPLWTPDGRQIAYSDSRGKMSIKAADGASEARNIFTSESAGRLVLLSMSPDGAFLAFRMQGGKTRWDIWLLPLKGDAKAYPFINSPASEGGAQFSPDGKWMSYVSDESGKAELFVVPFPGPGAKRQISSGGATFGYWISGGREIAYVTSSRKMFGVEVRVVGASLEVGESRPLFGGQVVPADGTFSPDGKRYLSAVPLTQVVAPPLTLVTNWMAGVGGS
ncbi:MAG: PD40 domain-containing protein [Acidobacteria bacterium]|nr:PD40 domain-containing protein [Acidobacteriota bacterium]